MLTNMDCGTADRIVPYSSYLLLYSTVLYLGTVWYDILTLPYRISYRIVRPEGFIIVHPFIHKYIHTSNRLMVDD